MNPYLVLVLVFLAGRYLLDVVADGLNLRHLAVQLPGEFEGYYDAQKYERSQKYLSDTRRLHMTQDTLRTSLIVLFILVGGFNVTDRIARSAGFGPIGTGLVFAGMLLLAGELLDLPFAAHRTFVLEECYGFNRTTVRTFCRDLLISWLLTALIGGGCLAVVLWFFQQTGQKAWVGCWLVMCGVQALLIAVGPYVILPLFNRFEPLEEGPLRRAIEAYARSQRFRMRGVFKMDGSKRSSKTNAFFTGLGRSRRIVLFDTLIDKHTVPELVAVIAHEMGHFKRKHVPWALCRACVVAGLTFYLLSLFLGNERLFAAFRMDSVSVYASLVFFGFLYTPLAMVFGVVENAVSRRQEYEADRFAVATTGDHEAMITALKRLTVENLGNLTPHPFKVWLDYSHPPVLARIEHIGAMPRAGSAQKAEGGDT